MVLLKEFLEPPFPTSFPPLYNVDAGGVSTLISCVCACTVSLCTHSGCCVLLHYYKPCDWALLWSGRVGQYLTTSA
jgi:hypothetical protein